MSVDQSDKLNSGIPAEPAIAGPRRRPRAAVWPMDTGASEDTFATPSQNPTGDVSPALLAGPEPAVFGGTNPNALTDGPDVPEAQTAEVATDPLGTPLDEAVRGDEMLPEAPRINYRRLFRSTPFLLALMISLLIGATYFVRMAIETECYVQTSVKFSNYDKLSEAEALELQAQIGGLLQTVGVRADAKTILSKKWPDVQPGFLDRLLTFYRPNATTWDTAGMLQLRVDAEDPADDIARMSAMTDAFYEALQKEHGKKLDEYRTALTDQKQKRADLLAKDAHLKIRVDALLADAQRYLDLKQAMQAMERYLELADETNPLRLVAKQNLARLTGQVADARKLSIERDDLLGQRVELQTQAGTAASEMARLQRLIDVFTYPQPPDPSRLIIHDTRGHQTFVLRTCWVGIIGCFGGLIVMFHAMDVRENARLRRERRALLAQAAARAQK